MPRSQQQKAKPLSAGKRFRLGEFIVETLIKGIAFVSIAAIVLIFIFVFREASPIVFGTQPSEGGHASTTQHSTTPTLEQEVYDPLAEPDDETPKESGNGLGQEIYDPE